MMVAMTVLFMALGAFVEALDLTVAALCSLVLVFVFIEIGSPYTWLVWLCSSVLGFVFFSGSFVWITYLLIFGIYPILKAYIERLPRVWWLMVKLAVFNAMLVLLIYLSELVFGVPLFAVDNKLFVAGLYALCNVAFAMYDLFLTVMIRTYLAKIRHRFSGFLK
jgi:hypothetical protein